MTPPEAVPPVAATGENAGGLSSKGLSAGTIGVVFLL